MRISNWSVTIFLTFLCLHTAWSSCLPLLTAGGKAYPALTLSQSAVRASGVWTDNIVLSGIRALHAAGRPLNARAMLLNKGGEESDLIVQKIFGRIVRASALYQQAIKIFGSWNAALVKAGIDPQIITVQTQWSPEMVIRGIQALSKESEGIDLSASRMQQPYPHADQVLQKTFGRAVTTQSLYNRARFYYKDWYTAIRAAGFDPKLYKKKFSWNRENIIAGLRALAEAKLKLSPRQFQKNNPAYVVTLSNHFQFLIRPSSLYAMAVNKYFNDWSDALLSAGFDPVQEFARYPHGGQFSPDEDDVIVEYHYDSEGRRVEHVQFGQIEKSPEQIFLENERTTSTQSILKKVLGKDAFLVTHLLEIMANDEIDADSYDEVALRLSQMGNDSYSALEVKELFQRLAQSPELQELRY